MDISQLQFRDKNPRLIKDENLEKLKKSIQDDPEFLTKRKILVNDTKDGMIVYAGNQRLRSLLALGYTEIPDEWIDIEKNIPLKLMEKRAFKDNVEYGEYDHDKLKDFDLEFLKELDLPEGELDLSELNDIELDEDKEDSIPEPAKVAKLIEIGDIIQLGPHRIMCGDSTDVSMVETLMDGNKADMVFTDPPYGVSYTGGHNKKKRQGIENDTLEGENLTGLFYSAITNAYMVSEDHSAFYIRYASGKSVETFASFAGIELELRAVIQWYKVHSGLGAFMSQYIPNCEPCMYAFKKGCTPQRYGKSDEKTVWELKREGKSEYHPTQKPIELPERAINNSSKEGQIILDLFLGSGSTLIACEKTNRICYGMELDPVYIEVIIKRYHEYTKGARDIKCLNRDLDLSPILKDEK